MPGPTHFPYNTNLSPTVIDLMFVANYVAVATSHEICLEDCGSSDHAPLVVVVPGSSLLVPVTKWSITPGSDEEPAYRGQVLDALQPLLDWNGSTQGEIDEVVVAISNAFASAWKNHAKESRRGSRSKDWWTQECSDALKHFRVTREVKDWSSYRRIMRAAKRDFFDKWINKVATTNHQVWDLTAWTRKCHLPSFEAISYWGLPCNDLESLWDALDGTYNSASNRPVDLVVVGQCCTWQILVHFFLTIQSYI
jgi:hypothetical protein